MTRPGIKLDSPDYQTDALNRCTKRRTSTSPDENQINHKTLSDKKIDSDFCLWKQERSEGIMGTRIPHDRRPRYIASSEKKIRKKAWGRRKIPPILNNNISLFSLKIKRTCIYRRTFKQSGQEHRRTRRLSSQVLLTYNYRKSHVCDGRLQNSAILQQNNWQKNSRESKKQTDRAKQTKAHQYEHRQKPLHNTISLIANFTTVKRVRQ